VPAGGRPAAVLGLIVAAALAVAVGLTIAHRHRREPMELWRLVNGACVPDQQQHDNPAPCALVDLHRGVAAGYVVLKDIRGTTQYLVIPTARVTGIEDPKLLRPGMPNYFAAAWQQRAFSERAVPHKLPRDAWSLAVNSPFARSQNQLHIHIDCLRRDVRAALRRQQHAIGDTWAPLAATLAGHRYWAMRVLGDELGGADPFHLLAAGKPGARAAMGQQTLVVAGAEFAGGRPGFILLNDQANLAIGDRASGEELQDHTCALARE